MQRKDLALSESFADRHHEERLEFVAVDHLEEAVEVLVREHTHLVVIDDRALVLVHRLGDVARELALRDRLRERAVHDRVQMVCGGRAQPQAALRLAGGHAPVELLEVSRRQLPQRLLREVGTEHVHREKLPVVPNRARPELPAPGDPGQTGEPLLEP